MKRIALTACLLTSSTVFAAEGPSIQKFSCKCAGSTCSTIEDVNITYNPETLFMKIDSEKIAFSGYATREEFKMADTVYLTMPRGRLSSGPTLVFRHGKLQNLNAVSNQFDCVDKSATP